MRRIAQQIILFLLAYLASHTAMAQDAFRAIYETKGYYIREWAEQGHKAPTALEIYPDRTFFYDMTIVARDSVTRMEFDKSNDLDLAMREGKSTIVPRSKC